MYTFLSARMKTQSMLTIGEARDAAIGKVDKQNVQFIYEQILSSKASSLSAASGAKKTFQYLIDARGELCYSLEAMNVGFFFFAHFSQMERAFNC